VVDLMSALRQSLAAKPATKTSKQEGPASPAVKRKLKLVSGKRSKTA
jgi:non-homologous end joining protein Ku